MIVTRIVGKPVAEHLILGELQIVDIDQGPLTIEGQDRADRLSAPHRPVPHHLGDDPPKAGVILEVRLDIGSRP